MSVSVLKMSACTKVRIDLQAVERDRDERHGEAGDDGQGDLPAEDVAEESHRQRDRLDELEDELDEADEEGDEPRPDTVPELVEGEELGEVAARRPSRRKPWNWK